jgi:DNA-binding transcriptional LysR family regulator
VTRAVAALEAALGAHLLQRTTRKVALTDAGAACLERVQPLLDELDGAADELRARTRGVRGTVRVTASVAYGQAVLVPLLPALHAQHPGLEVDLMLSDAAVVDVVTQRIDVALRLGPALLADWRVDRDLDAGRLVDLFPKHEATATHFDSAVWLLYASREHLPRRVRAFVDFVRQRLD